MRDFGLFRSIACSHWGPGFAEVLAPWRSEALVHRCRRMGRFSKSTASSVEPPDPRILFGAVAHEFITLFDANYLPRGIALHRSLEATGAEFRLRVVCMDEETERTLRRLALPNLIVIPLAELEQHDPELAAVKSDRTAVEYCWTATPAVCLYALGTEPSSTRSPTSTPTSCSSPIRSRSSTRSETDAVADRAAPLRARASAHGARSGIYNVGMADVPSRRGRARHAALVARPLHRVVLRARRGREDGRPEVPRRLADAVLARPRARASGRRARALERHGARLSASETARPRGRTAARLLPPSFAAPIPADSGRAARAAASQLAGGAPDSPLYWLTNYPVSTRNGGSSGGRTCERSRRRAQLIGSRPGRRDVPRA